MVFSSTWICISINVVLCDIPVLSELLSERPKGESWACCFSYSCFDMYNCCVHCSTCYCFVIFLNMMPPWFILHISASSTKLKANGKIKPPSWAQEKNIGVSEHFS